MTTFSGSSRSIVVHDDYFPCPHCGADVHHTATFCRACGADEASGWGDNFAESANYDTADDDDDFDYDGYLRREFPDEAPPAPPRDKLIAVVIILLIVALLFTMVL